MVIPRFAAYPLGSGSARFSVASPGTWPTGREPTLSLPTGVVARLVSGQYLQVHSTVNGQQEQIALKPFARLAAKPGAVTMSLRPDGTIFLANSAIGKAMITDPEKSFETTSVISFPPPVASFGGPSEKIVTSADGQTLYTLGGARTGGLATYKMDTGGIVASYSDGKHYIGLYQLPSGTILAVSGSNPRLAFFSPSLEPLTTANTVLNVSTVL